MGWGLKDWLGAALFHRSPSEQCGRAWLARHHKGLDHLSLGLERLKEGIASSVLTVSVSPAFAAKWLLPRIDRFQSRWPEIDLRFGTSLKLADYVAQGINIGVRYG